MPSFDSAFTGAFDSGSGGDPLPVPVLVGTGSATMAGVVSVVSPLVFASAAGYLRWYATVTIGGVDVSARLTGQIQISAGEDQARVASFEVVPASVAELDGYDSAAVTIDVTLFRTGQMATFRRFTGRVEAVDYKPDQRVASIDCRDGYQERIKAIKSAAEAAAMCGGLAATNQRLLAWDDGEPDPVGYFNGLLQTMRGAVAIDSSGVWQAVPWTIASPAASFTAGDVFDGSVSLSRPNRADVPSAIVATINHRYPRLHAAGAIVQWTGPSRYDITVNGLPHAPKTMIESALNGAGGWLVRGKIAMTEPEVGAFPVVVGPHTLAYIMGAPQAQMLCQSFIATMYRRWYQQVEVRYTATIETGGASDRDESISASLESTFDASAWESAPSGGNSVDVWSVNAPVTPPPTGFEGLLEPYPTENTAIDHYADLTTGDITAAVDFVVARALRKASAGARKQTVSFDRPFDPRWEIGAVLAVDAYGLAATGQLVGFDDTLDHDSGDAVSQMTLACPAGTGTVTSFTASATPPANTVSHSFPMGALGNHIGGSTTTNTTGDTDSLVGFLCNCLPAANLPLPAYSTYDAAKPFYNQQFRVVMPEIPADVRDPLTLTVPVTASIAIAGSGVSMVF